MIVRRTCYEVAFKNLLVSSFGVCQVDEIIFF